MSELERIASVVQSLKPGQRVRYSRDKMHEVPGMEYNGGVWNSADRVLSNVMGSSYGWLYDVSFMDESVEFCRIEESELRDGEMTYVDPDRRVYYDRLPNGRYRRNSLEYRR